MSETPMNRRTALRILGAIPVAGLTPHVLDAEAGTPAPASRDAATPPAPAGHGFFTPHELATVRVLSDLVIPRDERSGSATDARVPEYIDRMMTDASVSERRRVEMRGGLAWMDTESRKRFGKDFVQAAHAEQTAILDDIAWPAKARPEMRHGAAFFSTFRDWVASGFFSSEMGHRDLRYIGNVFHPDWHGCGDEANHFLGVSLDLMNNKRGPAAEHASE